MVSPRALSRSAAATGRHGLVEPAGAAGEAPTGAKGDLEAVARGGALSLVGAVVSAAANLALTIVVTHRVGRSTAGEFFALTSVFLLAETLCRLGADLGLVYFLARWRALGRFSSMRAGMRIALRPPLMCAAAVGVLLFASAGAVSRWIGASNDGVGLLRLLAVALPVAVTYDLCIAATRGWSRMRPTVFIEKIGRPVGQLVLVAVVLWVGPASLMGLAWTIPYAGGAVAIAFVVRALPWRRAARDQAPEIVDEPARVAREFWSFTAPRAVAAVAQLLLQRLDIVLVAALRGPVDAAIYTAATRFLVVGQFVNQALIAPSQPRLSALLAARDFERTRQMYQTSTSWLVLLVWPMYLGVAVLAPSYLAVFGSGYRSGLSVVTLLCLAMLFASGAGYVDVVLLMLGKTKWNLATTLVALSVDVVLDVILIPRIGIVGAAIGWCAAIVAANLVPGLLVYRLLGVHPFARPNLISMVVAATCFAGLPVLALLASDGSQVAGLGGVGLGTVVYVGLLWRLREKLLLKLAAAAIRRGR